MWVEVIFLKPQSCFIIRRKPELVARLHNTKNLVNKTEMKCSDLHKFDIFHNAAFQKLLSTSLEGTISLL